NAVTPAPRGDLVGQLRVSSTVGLGLATGCYRDRSLADAQVGPDKAQVVGAAQRHRALADGVVAHILAQLTRQLAGEGIAVGQAARGDLVGQRRVSIAVGLGLAIGRNRDRSLADAQVGPDKAQVVVAAQGQRALAGGV